MAEESGCCICFSNKTKAKCAKFVLIVSIVLILLGAFVAIYGYFGLDIEDTWVVGDEEFPSPLALFAIAAVLVGLFTIVTGVLGALTAKCKNACFAVPFAIFSLVLCVAMLIVAMLAFIGQSAGDTVRTNLCNGGTMMVSGESFNGMESYMNKMYGVTVDKFMCTGVCPCPSDKLAEFNDKASGTGFEAVKNQLYRTPYTVTGQSCEASDSLLELQSDSGRIPLCFKTSGKTFDTFKQCWEDPKDGLMKKMEALSGDEKKVSDINDVIKFIGTIEESLKECSGACSVPLFGIMRSVKEGPVTEECVETIVGTLDTLLGPGIVCLLTFFILLCACCGSCTLCRGFNKDDLMTGDDVR